MRQGQFRYGKSINLREKSSDFLAGLCFPYHQHNGIYFIFHSMKTFHQAVISEMIRYIINWTPQNTT